MLARESGLPGGPGPIGTRTTAVAILAATGPPRRSVAQGVIRGLTQAFVAALGLHRGVPQAWVTSARPAGEGPSAPSIARNQGGGTRVSQRTFAPKPLGPRRLMGW